MDELAARLHERYAGALCISDLGMHDYDECDAKPQWLADADVIYDEYKEETDAAMNYGDGYQAARREARDRVERAVPGISIELSTGTYISLEDTLDIIDPRLP